MIDFAQEQKIKVCFFGTRSVFANQFGHNSFVWAKIMGATYVVYLSAKDIDELIGFSRSFKKTSFYAVCCFTKKDISKLTFKPFFKYKVYFISTIFHDF